MPVSGDTKIRLIDGTDVLLRDLAGQAFDARVFGVQEPWRPVAVAGATMAGLIVASRARGARMTRPHIPVVTLELSNGEILRCGPTQLIMTRDGTFKVAEKLLPGANLRPLVTDIAPGTNGDILPIPDIAGRISTSSYKFPEIKVVSNHTSDFEDMWDLECPYTGNFGVSAKVFVYARATALR